MREQGAVAIQEPTDKHGHISAYELFMCALSAYILLALAAEKTIELSPHTIQVLSVLDSAVCVVFLADFVVQLGRAPNKLRYLRWGWIDFVSSIPMLPFLRWGRMIRIVRVIRILRGYRAAKVMTSVFFAHRAKGALASMVFICFLLVSFGSIAILHVETDASSNIHSAGDALWWSVATITTVGYGDRFPVTPEGRAIGIALMIAGIGLFGTFTAYLAKWFMESESGERPDVASEMHLLRVELQLLRKELSRERSM